MSGGFDRYSGAASGPGSPNQQKSGRNNRKSKSGKDRKKLRHDTAESGGDIAQK